jgi:hypothetical protein
MIPLSGRKAACQGDGSAALGRRLMKHVLILILQLSCRIAEPITSLHVEHNCMDARKTHARDPEGEPFFTTRSWGVGVGAFQKLQGHLSAAGRAGCQLEQHLVSSFLVFIAVKIKSQHLEPHMCDVQTPSSSAHGLHSLFLD